MKTAARAIQNLQAGTPAQRTREQQPNTQACDFRPDFDTFNEPELIQMRQMAVEFAAETLQVPRKPRWLSFLGGSGKGKTHIARQLYRWLRTKHGGQWCDGRFYRWQVVAEKLRSQEYDIMQAIAETEFVVIDDLFAAYDSGFLNSAIADICERRIGKWTLFTSNLTVQQIANKETRVASRLIRDRNRTCKLTEVTPDYAMRNNRTEDK